MLISHFMIIFCFIVGDLPHQEWFDQECIPPFLQGDQIPLCTAQDLEWDLDLVRGWIMALDLVRDRAFHQDTMDHFLAQCLDHPMDHSFHQVRLLCYLGKTICNGHPKSEFAGCCGVLTIVGRFEEDWDKSMSYMYPNSKLMIIGDALCKVTRELQVHLLLCLPLFSLAFCPNVYLIMHITIIMSASY